MKRVTCQPLICSTGRRPPSRPESLRQPLIVRKRGLLLDVAEREDLLLAPRQRAEGAPDPPAGVLPDRAVARPRCQRHEAATRVSQAPQLAGTRPCRSASCASRITRIDALRHE
jgi:hypothetical protein